SRVGAAAKSTPPSIASQVPRTLTAPTATIQGVIDPMKEIEGLVAFEARGPGTDAERRAASHLVEQLESLGREAQVEPTRVYPNYALAHLLHALLGIAGSIVSISAPLIG